MNSLRKDNVEGVDVAKPVLKKSVTVPKLIRLLRSQLDSMNLHRIRRNDRSMAIRRLEKYLGAVPRDPLVVNEQLLSDFENWLVGDDQSSRLYHRKATSHLRSVINAIPDGKRNRRLLTNTELRRLHRFDEFPLRTRELLEHFLEDGRIVKRSGGTLKTTSALLSTSVRENAVFAVTMLMRLVGVDDVTRISRKHVDQYLRHKGEDARETAIHTLWNMRPFFRNLAALGLVDTDPLDGIGQQKSKVNSDYVPADQIAKLADLATLDKSSFRDIRGRLIAFTLCYDYGLRIGEAARLKVSDVRLNDFVEIVLRGEIQKGAGKPPATLRNLFPESRKLFELYLELRQDAGSDSLLLSLAGKPMRGSGCRNAVKRVSEELAILTHAGSTPSPHRYRHSLGTLNVGELGMRLSPYYLMRRYRHNDLKVTTQVYVANNPLLDEAQHLAVVNAALGNGHAPEGDPKPRAMASDMTVPETAAMAKVRSLGVSWRSLRGYAIGERAAVKRGGKIFYSEAFLDRLCTEWMTRAEAMRLMGIASPTAYQNRVRNHGIETLVMGKASLAKSSDVIRSLRQPGS